MGRNSIYQRLVNRLLPIHVLCSHGKRGEGAQATERGECPRKGVRPGRRGEGKVEDGNGAMAIGDIDVDDRKTKIRNSNLSRERLISSLTLPSPPHRSGELPPLPAAFTVVDITAIATVAGSRPPYGRRARVPSSRDSYDNWQAVRAFNHRGEMAALAGTFQGNGLFLPLFLSASLSPLSCLLHEARLRPLTQVRSLFKLHDRAVVGITLMPSFLLIWFESNLETEDGREIYSTRHRIIRKESCWSQKVRRENRISTWYFGFVLIRKLFKFS